MLRQRVAVERPREKRFARQRFLAVETAAEGDVDLVFLRAPLDFLFAVIGAEEDELARRRLDAARIEDRLEPDAGPLAVAAQPLQRPAVAGALEAGDELGRSDLLEIVERELLRAIDEARDLQLVGGEVDV